MGCTGFKGRTANFNLCGVTNIAYLRYCFGYSLVIQLISVEIWLIMRIHNFTWLLNLSYGQLLILLHILCNLSTVGCRLIKIQLCHVGEGYSSACPIKYVKSFDIVKMGIISKSPRSQMMMMEVSFALHCEEDTGRLFWCFSVTQTDWKIFTTFLFPFIT